MKIQRRSKKFLIVSTAITIIALASVLTVSAAVLLGTINGGNVTVAGVASGQITYGTTADGSGGWSDTLEISTGSWYTKLSVDAGYSGPVTITWQLQSYATGTWTNAGSTTTTTCTLSGSGDILYATTDGTITGNRDWSQTATSQATYRVIATISSA